MRDQQFHNFMTLVVAILLIAVVSPQASLASVTTPQPNLDEPEKEQSDKVEKAPSEVVDTINITPVKKTQYEDIGVTSSEYFFPFRSSLSPRVGIVYNAEAMEEKHGLLYVIGFQYLFQTRDMKSYEIGADIITRGTGRLHLARRWLLTRTRTRPYLKAGGGFVLKPEQGMTTFIRYENLQARGAIGVEVLLTPPLSLRAEAELAAGIDQQEGIVTAGYSWAW